MGHSVARDIQLNVRRVPGFDQLPKNVSKSRMDERLAAGELDQLDVFGMLENLFKDVLLPSVNRRAFRSTEPCRMHCVRSNSRTEHRRTHPAFQIAMIAKPKMQRRWERHIVGTIQTVLCPFHKPFVSSGVQ